MYNETANVVKKKKKKKKSFPTVTQNLEAIKSKINKLKNIKIKTILHGRNPKSRDTNGTLGKCNCNLGYKVFVSLIGKEWLETDNRPISVQNHGQEMGTDNSQRRQNE